MGKKVAKVFDEFSNIILIILIILAIGGIYYWFGVRNKKKEKTENKDGKNKKL